VPFSASEEGREGEGRRPSFKERRPTRFFDRAYRAVRGGKRGRREAGKRPGRKKETTRRPAGRRRAGGVWASPEERRKKGKRGERTTSGSATLRGISERKRGEVEIGVAPSGTPDGLDRRREEGVGLLSLLF